MTFCTEGVTVVVFAVLTSSKNIHESTVRNVNIETKRISLSFSAVVFI